MKKTIVKETIYFIYSFIFFFFIYISLNFNNFFNLSCIMYNLNAIRSSHSFSTEILAKNFRMSSRCEHKAFTICKLWHQYK